MPTQTQDRKTRILLLCTGNSCRSQMAEGFLRSFDPGLEVFSAGTNPAPAVHPLAIAVMKEAGISLDGAATKSVDRFANAPFDYVITVCDDAKESCPVFTGPVRHRMHFGFEDPAEARGTEEERLQVFRRVRDQIRAQFQSFLLTTAEKNGSSSGRQEDE